MKEAIVYLESGVSVLIPTDIDPESEEGQKYIRDRARAKLLRMLQSKEELELNIDEINDI